MLPKCQFPQLWGLTGSPPSLLFPWPDGTRSSLARSFKMRVGTTSCIKPGRVLLFPVQQARGSHSVVTHGLHPWTVACQVPLSMDFSGQERWSGLPPLLQVIFHTQELNPGPPHCRQILYRLSHHEVKKAEFAATFPRQSGWTTTAYPAEGSFTAQSSFLFQINHQNISAFTAYHSSYYSRSISLACSSL